MDEIQQYPLDLALPPILRLYRKWEQQVWAPHKPQKRILENLS